MSASVVMATVTAAGTVLATVKGPRDDVAADIATEVDDAIVEGHDELVVTVATQ